MRSISALLFAMFAAVQLFASPDSLEVVKPRHQLAVNATFFLKQFLNFSNSSIEPISPYLLTYSVVKKGHGFRTGIGVDFIHSENTEDDSDDVRTVSGTAYDMRVGYEYQLQLSRAWWLFTGIDVIARFNKDKVVSGTAFDNFTTETKEHGFGAGPVLGIQVNFNKRIGLFTETALYFTNSKSVRKEESGIFQQVDDSKETTTITQIRFTLPTSLFFVIRFGSIN
jgi:hypothetical protein